MKRAVGQEVGVEAAYRVPTWFVTLNVSGPTLASQLHWQKRLVEHQEGLEKNQNRSVVAMDVGSGSEEDPAVISEQVVLDQEG
nr:uncharacterized protein CTRU02_01832 [Colletotrichum truncatum]KAF6798961.1 hypothetical protein CTRU02_01832 [Colletotrichum truncatum]